MKTKEDQERALCTRMRNAARAAAKHRLAGKIRDASSGDQKIEGIYDQARRAGLSEDALVGAEDEGRREAALAWSRKTMTR